MGNRYNPDAWVLVKITDPKSGEQHVRVCAGWSGGYLDGDSWKLSSGVVKVEQTNSDYYDFHNHSGSVYHCHKKSEGLRMCNGGIYNRVVAELGAEDITVDELNEWLTKATDGVLITKKG